VFITPNYYRTDEHQTGRRSEHAIIQSSWHLRFPLDPSAKLPVAILIAAAAVGWLAAWEPVWIAAMVLLAGVAFLSRDPERSVDAPPGAILSPADGRVIGIRWAAFPELGPSGGPCISIFLSILDVHVNRAPCAGTVDTVVYQPGGHCDARRRESTENECNWIILRCGESHVAVRQIAGRFARRVICRAPRGSVVDWGDRIGFIRLGSRVELYLPAGSAVKVRPGQRVRGGLTLVGYLPESAPVSK
jgi:phosphatidylserine decarboxylase